MINTTARAHLRLLILFVVLIVPIFGCNNNLPWFVLICIIYFVFDKNFNLKQGGIYYAIQFLEPNQITQFYNKLIALTFTVEINDQSPSIKKRR